MALNEATLLVKQWLEHPVYGVNALAASVPRTRIGGVGQYPAPRSVTIYSDVDDAVLTAEDLDPPMTPALIVYIEDDAELEPGGATERVGREKLQPMRATIVYIDRDAEKTVSQLDCGLVLRAVKMSLRRFNDQTISASYRTLNDVTIKQVARLVERRIAGAVGKATLWGFIEGNLTIIDTHP